MVLAVLIVGTMVVMPPRKLTDVAFYGVGTAVGLMVTDSITSGQWEMPMVSPGCGCSR